MDNIIINFLKKQGISELMELKNSPINDVYCYKKEDKLYICNSELESISRDIFTENQLLYIAQADSNYYIYDKEVSSNDRILFLDKNNRIIHIDEYGMDWICGNLIVSKRTVRRNFTEINEPRLVIVERDVVPFDNPQAYIGGDVKSPNYYAGSLFDNHLILVKENHNSNKMLLLSNEGATIWLSKCTHIIAFNKDSFLFINNDREILKTNRKQLLQIDFLSTNAYNHHELELEYGTISEYSIVCSERFVVIVSESLYSDMDELIIIGNNGSLICRVNIKKNSQFHSFNGSFVLTKRDNRFDIYSLSGKYIGVSDTENGCFINTVESSESKKCGVTNFFDGKVLVPPIFDKIELIEKKINGQLNTFSIATIEYNINGQQVSLSGLFRNSVLEIPIGMYNISFHDDDTVVAMELLEPYRQKRYKLPCSDQELLEFVEYYSAINNSSFSAHGDYYEESDAIDWLMSK